MSEDKKAQAKVGQSTYELEKSVFVVAIAEGYYGNRLRREGDKFQYNGRVKRNSKGEFILPNWMVLDEKAAANDLKVKGHAAKKKAAPKKEEKKESKASDLV